ncbi:hypothetical protein [Haloechinothrix sp. LS1_15]|nr:hypothetical protein [Haloechinothrix sp. LS1_15]
MSTWHRADGTIIIHDYDYDYDYDYDEVHIITPDDPDHPTNTTPHGDGES